MTFHDKGGEGDANFSVLLLMGAIKINTTVTKNKCHVFLVTSGKIDTLFYSVCVAKFVFLQFLLFTESAPTTTQSIIPCVCPLLETPHPGGLETVIRYLLHCLWKIRYINIKVLALSCCHVKIIRCSKSVFSL